MSESPTMEVTWYGRTCIRLRGKDAVVVADPYQSVVATLRALIDENATARRRLGITTGLMLGAVALLALALRQLEAVGKMTADNVVQGAILFGGLMAAIAAYKAWHYLSVLKPEGKRLQRLLADYGA